MSFPQVIVEAGFDPISTSTAFILDSATKGVLDVNTLGGLVWTDISAYASKISTKRGASRADGPILRYEAGTCTISLFNNDRRFDPTNLSGPYVSGGATQVLPMLPVRVTAIWAGVSYEIFSGYADSWDVEWIGYGDSTCTVACTDATKVLVNYDRVALTSPVGAAEDSGARVNRILDSVAWPSYARDVAVGDSTLQATTMDRSAWEELLLVQDSEIGEVYVDGGGNVVFNGRTESLFGPTATVSQATFGDAVGELPFTTTAISYDDTTISNLVRISNVGGTQQIAEDFTSETAYLVHTHDRTDLILETDADAMTYASFVLYQSKDPELRFTTLGVNPHDDEPALFPQILGRKFGDRITVNKRPPGGGTISRDVLIRGVSHEMEGPDVWTTTFALQSATKFQAGAFILDHVSLGKLDVGILV